MADEKLPGEHFPGDQEENIRLENEILQMKLQAEFGADFHFEEGTQLSAQQENEFLRYVYAFEQMHHNAAPQIPLYDKIGKPAFTKQEELTDAQVTEALHQVMEILYNHRFVLDTCTEYPDRVIYKFITEELFLHLVDDVDMPGCVCHFIYEEFHPNHDMDLRRHSQEFIDDLVKKDIRDESIHLHTHFITYQDETIESNEAYEKIRAFCNDFYSFTLNSFEITNVNFDEELARVTFILDMAGWLSEKEKVIISSQGVLEFIKDFGGYWYLHKISMPGLII